MYSVKIICDSISETGKRLTTFEITFPRIVLAEFNTHRTLSRNSASSRAIPFKTQLERTRANPFIPEQFPINHAGMQPKDYIREGDYGYLLFKDRWLDARNYAIIAAENLYEGFISVQDGDDTYVRCHKQIVNRLLEPFMWHTVIVTATEWDNFFKLRTNEQAQYEIRRIADLMYDCYHFAPCPDNKEGCEVLHKPKPNLLKQNEWHLPFISDEDKISILDYIRNHVSSLRNDGFVICSNDSHDSSQPVFTELQKRISVARCARVSYLTHDGKRDIEKDLELFDKLRTSGHWSPFEHVACPYWVKLPKMRGLELIGNQLKEGFEIVAGREKGKDYEGPTYDLNVRSGNFIGWKQYRKEFQDENCTHFRK